MRRVQRDVHNEALQKADLGAADFGGGGILHEVVYGNAAVAAQPGRQVHDPHRHIVP